MEAQPQVEDCRPLCTVVVNVTLNFLNVSLLLLKNLIVVVVVVLTTTTISLS